jgi:hypothetical protein
MRITARSPSSLITVPRSGIVGFMTKNNMNERAPAMMQIIQASRVYRGRTAMFVKDSEEEKHDEGCLKEDRGRSVNGKDLAPSAGV